MWVLVNAEERRHPRVLLSVVSALYRDDEVWRRLVLALRRVGTSSHLAAAAGELTLPEKVRQPLVGNLVKIVVFSSRYECRVIT